MIQHLATRHQRKLALLLLLIFYLELVFPNIANALSPADSHFISRGKKGAYFFNKTKIDVQKKFHDFTASHQLKSEFHSGPEKTSIGGPGQPEMSSFKSVNSNDMVDLFTGDFSYNIPLMDVGGYPINIHYSSNVSMDQEATWVGLGWNINPGTIGRSVRGMPDDFNGIDTIAKTQSVKINKTVGVTVGADLEIVGLPIKKPSGGMDTLNTGLGFGASLGIFNNSYNGFGVETSVNASINAGAKSFGSLSAGLSLSNNSQTGANIHPSIGYTLESVNGLNTGKVSMGLSTNYNSRTGISSLQLNTSARLERRFEDNERLRHVTNTSGPSASISFVIPTYTPSISIPYTSTNYSFHGKVGLEMLPLHPSPYLEGYVSKQEIKPEDKIQRKPAVGFLYYSKSNDNTNTLLDFNREKDIPFNSKSTPTIAIPQYTYDVYSISGEGTGGMFRPYRGDVGFVRDSYVKSKSNSDRLSIDLGFGNVFHGGVDFSFTNAYSENNLWTNQNDIRSYLKFKESDTTYEAVYFRNPGERTTNAQSYYNSIGNDELIRVKLNGTKENVKAANSFLTLKNGRQTSEIPITSPVVKTQRDKRSQIISYLNAEETSVYGLEKEILSYQKNSIPGYSCEDSVTKISRWDNIVRKKHHLSQITVLNGDGRRYVYGLPAYNVEQKDVTFSVNEETNSDNLSKGEVSYTPGLDNSIDNNKGKENLFTKDSVPAYAHSFLLTGIVSSDYVDIKNDGITEDDIGDAIKFNYTRVYGEDNGYFSWRTPFAQNKANYNEGLKTYTRDDKGTYLFGKKEVWYLNSVESKTMIAVFKIVNDRKDIYSAADENGGFDTAKKLGRLEQIDLYIKADLVKQGLQAKPVKTVHFAYSYSLCKGVTGIDSIGKLTLDSIWFSYNGNEKGKLNPYVFKYHPSDETYNPSYNPKWYDRWGNYKDPSQNPAGLSNSDYPYAQQDSMLTAKYSAVWTLSEIQLPSGGKMKVTYEADDYGYVQNKRATQFFRVIGVGKTQNATPNISLYEVSQDYNYVFVKSDITLSTKQEIFEKYLEGNQYIYFKLSVKVPSDKWGSGNEFVPLYAQVEDYGLINGNKFWVKLRPVDGQGAMARSAIQFLRLNLPSKAYPNSEVGDDVWAAVKLVATSFAQIKDAFTKFDKHARKAGFCKMIDTTKSFIRLNNPNYKKFGGGLRVKKIEVFDNWKKMTNQKESVYGQEYSYTTSRVTGGQKLIISSGVASYEPMIGAEENPFRTPISYAEKTAPLAPVNYMFEEMPLGETYYPSAMVGYSKVRIRTINAKAKSANGWQETEFFTTKDFPTQVENSIIDQSAKKTHNPRLNAFLRINAKNYITLSQGFRIELNDMNGKIKSQSAYAETDSIRPISYVRNFYKVDNDSAYQKHLNNEVWVVDSLNGHIKQNGLVGLDIEVMQDFREQVSKTISGNWGVNLDYFQVGIFPVIIPSSIPLPQKEEVRYRSSATVKIVQRYGILDSVVVMDKGSIVRTKNLLYDGETGEVLLSRTNNEFNDPIYNFSYPAHWAYSGMGMAYKNIDAIFKKLKLIKGKLYYGGPSTTPYPVERFFESGDEVQLVGVIKASQTGDNCLQFEVDSINSTSESKPLPLRAWVIDASKAKEGDKGLYFIDEEGNPATGQVDYMRILRSGKRNMLDASVGSIISMKSPIRDLGTENFKLVFDSLTRIINTSAVTYKDQWKVENFVYPKDTAYKVYHNYTVALSPQKITNKRFDINSAGNVFEDSYKENAKNIAASFNYIEKKTILGITCLKGRSLFVKTLLNFDLSDIPKDATVNSASISFKGRIPKDLWVKKVSSSSTCSSSSFDWIAADDYKKDSSLAYLKKITAPWSASASYKSIQTTETNKVALNYNVFNAVSCTNLIQDLISNKNYGLSFEIDKTNPTSSTHNEINYLNFCAGNETNINSPGCGADPLLCNCTAPVLVINYQALDDSIAVACRNLSDDSIVNPYKFGILGNWRMDRAYTFYHDRKESDASISETNIRKDGELKSFSAFWQFTDSVLLPLPDTTKWVWNSASSLYSKKGFEIENYDPLGRYNSGLYGYNGTLPVAVAQNSRYRELLYDGFEDYEYKSKECAYCNTPRDVDFVKSTPGVWLTDTTSHTGQYSMKVSANSEASFTSFVYSADTASSISFAVDSGVVNTSFVVGSGNGLTGNYRGYIGSCPIVPDDSYTLTGFEVSEDGPLTYNWGSGAPGTLCNNWFDVSWEGLIQAPYTDNYRFFALSDRAVQVYINGQNVVDAVTPNVQSGGIVIRLNAGQFYSIEVKYSHTVGNYAYAQVKWMREGNPGVLQIIPQNYLYKAKEPDTTNTIDTLPVNCISTGKTKANNFTRPVFSPLQNSQLLVSAWVKMDGNDCNTASPLDSVLKATLYDVWEGTSQVILKRTGVRIEGWQRYEGVVQLHDIVKVKISANAPSERNIFVDDIRVQPFNSSMKSFAYDPVTLRLMAELDENNYATFYEYDDDGTLIRVKKETERGIMTIKESRSALVKNN